MTSKYTLLLITVLFCFGCYENVDNTPTEPEVIIETQQVIVNTRISGSVLDAEGVAAEDYYLQLNGTTEDVAGDHFYVEVEEVRKKGQNIYIVKNGVQRAIHTALLIENDINHLTIHMHEVPSEVEGALASSTVQISKELEIDFRDAKVTTNHPGDVKIESVLIADHVQMTPVAYNQDSHPLAVESMGGFYIDVSSTDGISLEIDKETAASLEIGALDAQINGLFVLDRASSLWIWVADVSSDMSIPIHRMGYYAWGRYTKGVFVEGVITKEESPVAYQPMQWQGSSNGNTICATENGKWIAVLPENEEVQLDLVNPCGESVQTERIDIANIDLIGQDLMVGQSGTYQYLNTIVLDCEGVVVVGGSQFSLTTGSNQVQYAFAQGQQDRWIAVCQEFSIAAVDPATGADGTSVDWSASLDQTIDYLSDCEAFGSGFSYIKIRDEREIYGAFAVTVEGDRTVLTSAGGEIKVIFKGLGTGNYQENQVNLAINDPGFGDRGYFVSCENSLQGCGIKDFEVTHYDTNTDGQVRVKFKGDIWMQTLSPAVAGLFPVEGVIISKQ